MVENSKFVHTYNQHESLQNRKEKSLKQLNEIKTEFNQEDIIFKNNNISVFAAGSLGRLEYGKKSDLDVFLISQKEEIKKLDEIQILNKLILINQKTGFEDFSNDGQFLKIYKLQDLKTEIGSSKEDAENLFTTRILFLLESQFLCNEEIGRKQLEQIISYYYRDDKGKKDFRSLFLINDILRFWRTLCLNYEHTRGDKSRPWRKKNFNLKFSRMLTVFSTILPIITKPIPDQNELIDLCKYPPLQRLSRGLDKLKSSNLSTEQYNTFLSNYEYFLSRKESSNLETDLDTATKETLNEKAAEFSKFLYKALNDNNICERYRQYLVI